MKLRCRGLIWLVNWIKYLQDSSTMSVAADEVVWATLLLARHLY